MATRQVGLASALSAVVLGAVCCGVELEPATSNFGGTSEGQYPDGGALVCAAPTAQNEGAANLTGPRAFGVRTALEVSEEWIPLHPDGGVVDGGIDRPAGVAIALYDSEVSCGEDQSVLDGSESQGWRDRLTLELLPRAGGSYVGAYEVVEIPDAGWADGMLTVTPPDGGALQNLGLLSGEVYIESESACALTGNFSLVVGTGAVQYCGVPDGGAPIICAGQQTTLTGDFAPVYCR